MADQKISELTSITGSNVADAADVLAIVDTSESTTKKITRGELFKSVGVLELLDGSAASPSLTNTDDTDTGLFFPAADALAVSTGGSERLRVDSSGNVGIGESSPERTLHVKNSIQNVALIESTNTKSFLALQDSGSTGNNYVRVGSDGDDLVFDAGASERMRIDSSGRLLIGGTTGNGKLHIKGSGGTQRAIIEATDGNQASWDVKNSEGEFRIITDAGTLQFFDQGDGAERMRIDTSGNVLIGQSASTSPGAGNTTGGMALNGVSGAYFSRGSGTPVHIGRNTNDGFLVAFYQDGTLEGNISVSGTTVSYNGGHLSRNGQLIDLDMFDKEDRPEILRGSVLTNLDEMCEWRGVRFDVPVLLEPAVEVVEAVAEIPEEKDEEGNVTQEFVAAVEAVEAKDAVWGTETKTVAYFGDKADGEKETVEFDGETYEGVIYTEANEQLNKMEVSSVKGDKNAAGVFQGWDDDDDEYLNDFHCAMTGDFVIRIAKGCAVERGNLLMSAGDGTACPQEGELTDVVRSCTVAKVTSTHVTHTYDDGSYLVPCVLMAC